MLVERYGIYVNGIEIHSHERKTPVNFDNESLHPLDYFKSWMKLSGFILTEEANVRLDYIRHHFQSEDDDTRLSYKDLILHFYIQDLFSIKLGENKYMEEQDLWLLCEKEEEVKAWKIMFEGDIGLQSLIRFDHEMDHERVGLGFVAEHEYLTVEECDALLAFCNARTKAIKNGRERYN